MTETSVEVDMQYGLQDGWRLFATLPFLDRELDWTNAGGGSGTASNTGLGDVVLGAAYTPVIRDDRIVDLQLGLSLPTGDFDARDDYAGATDTVLPYAMQLGTGTVDLHPSVSLMKRERSFVWGARLGGRFHTDKNSDGWARSDEMRLDLWGSVPLADRFVGTARLRGDWWGDLHGNSDDLDETRSALEDPHRQRGSLVQVVLGVAWDIKDPATHRKPARDRDRDPGRRMARWAGAVTRHEPVDRLARPAVGAPSARQQRSLRGSNGPSMLRAFPATRGWIAKVMSLALTLSLLLAAPLQDAPEDAPDLQLLLEEAVDLPNPEARAERADVLAKLDGVSLEQWIAATQAFAPREGGRAQSGRRQVLVDLNVLGTLESTSLDLVIPEDYDPAQPTPLLVALHGSGGSGEAEVYSWRATAAELGALLLAPTEAGRNAGFEGSHRERAAILEAIRWMRRTFHVDEDRIWLTGFSRGGHLTWDLALRYPDVFAAAVPCAGGPRFQIARGGNNMRFLENLSGLPLRCLVGEHETEGLLWNVREGGRRAKKLDLDNVEIIEIEGVGHGFQPTMVPGWVEWYGGAVRDPLPTEVVRRAVREDEARRHWLEVGDFLPDVKEVFQPTLRVPRGTTPDQAALRKAVIDQAGERTARVEARFVEPGQLRFKSVGARRVRLLLPESWLPEKGKLRVHDGRRKRSVAVERSARVLLDEFVERFDRRFLPVAEVVLKVKGK